MNELTKPARVAKAGEKHEMQNRLNTLEDVPAIYRDYPDFDSLTIDPAHGSVPEPKTIREAMSAVEAVMNGTLKAPLSRPKEGYIDFYDGEGRPIDVKTPLSPSKRDKWEFSYVQSADKILEQLEKTEANQKTGRQEPVIVLLDSTYMTQEDHTALWRELRRRTKEDRSILNGITEVCVRPDLPTRTMQQTLIRNRLGGKAR